MDWRLLTVCFALWALWRWSGRGNLDRAKKRKRCLFWMDSTGKIACVKCDTSVKLQSPAARPATKGSVEGSGARCVGMPNSYLKAKLQSDKIIAQIKTFRKRPGPGREKIASPKQSPRTAPGTGSTVRLHPMCRIDPAGGNLSKGQVHALLGGFLTNRLMRGKVPEFFSSWLIISLRHCRHPTTC